MDSFVTNCSGERPIAQLTLRHPIPSRGWGTHIVEELRPFFDTSSPGAKRRGDPTDHQRLRLPRFACRESRSDVNGTRSTPHRGWGAQAREAFVGKGVAPFAL